MINLNKILLKKEFYSNYLNNTLFSFSKIEPLYNEVISSNSVLSFISDGKEAEKNIDRKKEKLKKDEVLVISEVKFNLYNSYVVEYLIKHYVMDKIENLVMDYLKNNNKLQDNYLNYLKIDYDELGSYYLSLYKEEICDWLFVKDKQTKQVFTYNKLGI